MKLITAAAMVATHFTCVRMVERFLDKALLKRVGSRVVTMCGLSAFVSWLPDLVRSGEAPGQGSVGAS